MQMLRDKMQAVMADANSQVAEREELIELIAIALLTRKNLFILGAPGQATHSAAGSPARGSLNACSPSRPMRSSFLAASTLPA